MSTLTRFRDENGGSALMAVESGGAALPFQSDVFPDIVSRHSRLFTLYTGISPIVQVYYT